MTFTLAQVVPWGRAFDEYLKMFDLSDRDLQCRILGCADGPASFNSVATKLGIDVTSCDPIYQFSREEIEERIRASFEAVMAQVHANEQDYVWNEIRSPAHLADLRRAAMSEFLADYDAGKSNGRYICQGLPSLPFEDKEFDIALSSHFLFLYSGQLTLEFHQHAIREMCRVAKEVRIFPLLDLARCRSKFIDPVTTALVEAGYRVEIRKVPYEFLRGGNAMISIGH